MTLTMSLVGFDHINRIWLTVMIESSLKAVATLILAGLLVKALRRRPASIRHLVWSLAITCAVTLPALSLMIPAWQVGALSKFGISLPFAVWPSELRPT